MIVLDCSGVVDYLLAEGASERVGELLRTEQVAAPEVMTFEVLAVLRRLELSDELAETRAAGAVEDLADLPVMLFPSLPLRGRAWELRHNLTAAGALYIALAEELGARLATKDGGLHLAAGQYSTVESVLLTG